ncbi:hypothetical protein AB6809_29505 [Paraburkholderia sp. RCC_158]|uniref:hypothetical protein n=1 Tax=Paraburkholderia sp. RCC_158 TaxID=3239220 RepID=UPI003526710E
MMRFIPPRVDPFKHVQPRYVAYCVAQGAASAAAQEQVDKARWGHRWMMPFAMWLSDETRQWCRETNTPPAGMSWTEHAAFTEWLTARYPVVAPVPEQVRKVANGRSRK